MDKNQTEYLALAARIRELDEAYYEKDTPLATNAEYDALKARLEAVETDHPDWKTTSSPSVRPSGRPSKNKKKVTHPRRLLSLKDYFNTDDLRDWYDRIGAPEDMSVEQKIDGLTLALEYRNGRFIQGATRGDGDIGEDVTANVQYVKGIPMTLPKFAGVDPDANTLRVRLEVYQPVAEFQRCNESREEQGLEPYANPRACASGGLRSDDFRECLSRGLSTFAFQILDAEGWDAVRDGTQTGDLALLEKCGFDVVAHKKCHGIDEILDEIQHIRAIKDSLPYWTDGAVVKTDSLILARRIGEGTKYPVHSAAYKYPAEIKHTRIRKILLQTGRTGVVTPVAEIVPIQLAGTNVSRVTLHNQKFIRDHMIDEGYLVAVTKSGEIIPKVVSVPAPAQDYFRIDICPACGASLTERHDQDGNPVGVMVCPNAAGCPAQALRYLEFFCSKDVMDIAGLGPAALEALWDAGLVEHAWDIYDLPYKLEEIAALPGFGKAKANALAKAVNASKGNDIDRLIKALGITGVGRHTGRMLAHEYQDMEQIRRLGADTLMSHDGIGEITARDFTDFWSSSSGRELYEKLKSKGVNTVSKSWKLLDSDAGGTSGAKPLEGMSIVATGTIEGFGRADIEDFITANGGKASSSVSKKTTCVIAGANAGSKLKKAQDLGIPIYGINEFREKFGI